MSFTLAEQRAFITTDEPDVARRKCTDIWVTKDLRAIEPKDMEDTHLLKAIAMLIRNASFNNEVAAMKMLRFAAKASDGAADGANQEALVLMEASRDDIIRAAAEKYPVIHTLAKVVVERGLDWTPVVDGAIARGTAKFISVLARAKAEKAGEISLTGVLAATADAYKPSYTYVMPTLDEALTPDPHEIQVGN